MGENGGRDLKAAIGAKLKPSHSPNTWDALIADHRFRFAEEPEGFETQLRTLSAGFENHPKGWQEAYLAAFAIRADTELVTFDAGFRSFPGLRHRIMAVS